MHLEHVIWFGGEERPLGVIRDPTVLAMLQHGSRDTVWAIESLCDVAEARIGLTVGQPIEPHLLAELAGTTMRRVRQRVETGRLTRLPCGRIVATQAKRWVLAVERRKRERALAWVSSERERRISHYQRIANEAPTRYHATRAA